MLEALVYALGITGASTFAIILGTKWKWIEYLQVHGGDFISKMSSCQFCLSFWTNLVLILFFSVIVNKCELLFFIPLCTVITRALILM